MKTCFLGIKPLTIFFFFFFNSLYSVFLYFGVLNSWLSCNVLATFLITANGVNHLIDFYFNRTVFFLFLFFIPDPPAGSSSSRRSCAAAPARSPLLVGSLRRLTVLRENKRNKRKEEGPSFEPPTLGAVGYEADAITVTPRRPTKPNP